MLTKRIGAFMIGPLVFVGTSLTHVRAVGKPKGWR